MTEAPVPLAQSFPGITRAALSMTYDNGGINRDRTEADMLGDLREFLSKCVEAKHSGLRATLYSQLRAIDNWLNKLSDQEIDTVCNGEETEAADAVKQAPDGTSFLLNGMIENVV